MVNVEVVDMTDGNKETAGDERGARRGEWGRSLKDGALGLISEGKKQYSIAQYGAVWCSMEAEVSVKQALVRGRCASNFTALTIFKYTLQAVLAVRAALTTTARYAGNSSSRQVIEATPLPAER